MCGIFQYSPKSIDEQENTFGLNDKINKANITNYQGTSSLPSNVLGNIKANNSDFRQDVNDLQLQKVVDTEKAAWQSGQGYTMDTIWGTIKQQYEFNPNYNDNIFYQQPQKLISIAGDSTSMPGLLGFTKINRNVKMTDKQLNPYAAYLDDNNAVAYSTGGGLVGAYPENDNDNMMVDGLSTNFRERLLQQDETYTKTQKFLKDSSKDVVDKFKSYANQTLDYIKRSPETFGKYYKDNEFVITVATGAEVGSLTGIRATYMGSTSLSGAYFGKVVLNIGTATRLAGETCYQLSVSTESGINKTMNIAGSLLAEFLGKKIDIGKKFKSYWQDAEKLKSYGKTQADVDIIATILRSVEGLTYSEIKNVFVDSFADRVDKAINQSKEVYEW